MSLQDHVKTAKTLAQTLDGLLNNFAATGRSAYTARIQAPDQRYNSIPSRLYTDVIKASDALRKANRDLIQEINAVKTIAWQQQPIYSAADEIDFLAGSISSGIEDMDVAIESRTQNDITRIIAGLKADIADIVRKTTALGQLVGGVAGGRRKTRKGKKRTIRRRRVFA